MSFINTKKILFAFIILFVAVSSATAQDMLARQAPVDRKMKAVDTLTLKRLINREQATSPAAELYEDWDNTYAHRATELPDSFKINLRNFCMPTPSRVITSNFGARWGRQHKGLDLKVYIGDTIRAAFSGRVRIVRYEARGYGHYVVIRHNNGLETTYAHMSKSLVEENQPIKAGEVVGLGGNTGRSTGSHLHFETRLCGVALNPALFFDFRNQDVVGDYYMFRRDSYQEEGREATALRGKTGNGSYTREQVTGKPDDAESTEGQQYAETPRYHKVRRGETLSSIAKKRGTTIENICRLNRIGKVKRLKVGQILRFS